jgi:hypothetical protein
MLSDTRGILSGLVVVAVIAFWVGFETGKSTKSDPMPCTAGPGEISHMDERGFCAVTRKGRVVTRYQT